MLNAALMPAVEPFDASKFEHVYSFDEVFPQELNTLFADKDRRLWLTDGTSEKIHRGKEYVPLKEALRGEFKEITLREALAWYARCEPFSCSGTGAITLLCEMAAEKFKEFGID